MNKIIATQVFDTCDLLLEQAMQFVTDVTSPACSETHKYSHLQCDKPAILLQKAQFVKSVAFFISDFFQPQSHEMRSYFASRQNRVKLDSVVSDWREAVRGCPPGIIIWSAIMEHLPK